MNRRIEIALSIIAILLACVTLFLGDNLFQQVTGRSFFESPLKESNQPSENAPIERVITATLPPNSTPSIFPIATLSSPKRTEITIIVPSTAEWQNTTIQLSVGDKVSISASGEWSHGYQSDFASTPYYDADGFDKYDSTVYLPSSKVGALIGQIGNGSLFLVGSKLEFVSSESGVLYLGINDTPGSYARDNNAGELTATIIIVESQ